MFRLKYVATIVCDHDDPAGGHGCTETAAVEGGLPWPAKSPDQLSAEARAEFDRRGWRVGVDGSHYCPRHAAAYTPEGVPRD